MIHSFESDVWNIQDQNWETLSNKTWLVLVYWCAVLVHISKKTKYDMHCIYKACEETGRGGRVGATIWTGTLENKNSVVKLGGPSDEALHAKKKEKNKQKRTGCFQGGSQGSKVRFLLLSIRREVGSHLKGMKRRFSRGQSERFLSLSCFIMFFSPRWQPVDFPVLQAFLPLKNRMARGDEETCALYKLKGV